MILCSGRVKKEVACPWVEEKTPMFREEKKGVMKAHPPEREEEKKIIDTMIKIRRGGRREPGYRESRHEGKGASRLGRQLEREEEGSEESFPQTKKKRPTGMRREKTMANVTAEKKSHFPLARLREG